jgi:hypothetical protein
MMKKYCRAYSIIILCLIGLGLLGGVAALAAQKPADDAAAFPRSLESYNDQEFKGIGSILANRIKQEPFNLVATLIFFCAIIHTFLTSKFIAISHKWENDHEEKKKQGLADRHSVHHGAELFHFLGEVEAVFGIWVIALACAIFAFYDWNTVITISAIASILPRRCLWWSL